MAIPLDLSSYPTELKGYRNTIDGRALQSQLDSILGADIGQVTSRDDIINPYEILNINNYKRTARGQALYQSHLAALQEYAARQQAAYDEWYNSEQSQVARLREVGLNPDINGIEPAQAPETGSSEIVPGANLPTSGQTAMNAVSTVASLVSTIGSIAALPASIGASMASAGAATAAQGLTQAQTRLSNLQTVAAASGGFFQSISDVVAKARQAAVDSNQDFDAAAFLSDSKNLEGIFETYVPSDLSESDGLYKQFRSSYDRTLDAVRRIESESAKINKDADQSTIDWIRVKANPLVSTSDRLSLATFLPLGKAYFDLEKAMLSYQIKSAETKKRYMDNIDVLSAADAFNRGNAASISESSYNQEYYHNLSGENMANYTSFIKESEAILALTRGTINKHYRDIWTDSSKSWSERQAALFMIMDGVSRQASDFLIAQFFGNNNPMSIIGESRLVPHGDSSSSEKMFYLGDRMLDL